MKGAVHFLLLLLVLQCALAAWVYWPRDDRPESDSAGPLLLIEPNLVDEIHIADDRDNEIVLRNREGRWLLSGMDELPADDDRVRTLIKGLSQTTPVWPVAKTAAARQRFQVADYHYQRRIILIGGDKLLGTVYLGTSPGFRKVHARADREKSVYAIEFNSFDAPASAEPWLDRTLLQMRVPISVASDTYDISRAGDGWLSGWGMPPDQRELLALLDALEHMQVSGLAGEEAQRELASLDPLLTLYTDSLSGDQVLELYTLDDTHYVHSSRYQTFFVLPEDDFNRLNTVNAERMMGGSRPTSTSPQSPEAVNPPAL